MAASDSKDFEERPGVIVRCRQLKPGENWRIGRQYEVSYPGNTVLAQR